MGKYYPICLDLKGKKSLVIGGGAVAERKVKTLLNCYADVHLITPELTDDLRALYKEGKITYSNESFSEVHLKDVFIVICATDNPDINTQVSRAAKKNNILVNIVDVPQECNFIVPAIVEKGDLIISISTSGSSPALAKKIRKELQEMYGDEYKIFLAILREIREDVISKFPTHQIRNKVFTKIVDSKNLLSLIKMGKTEVAKDTINNIIQEMKGKQHE